MVEDMTKTQSIQTGTTITTTQKTGIVVDGQSVMVDLVRTFTVVEPANESGMLRVECIDETAERFGVMGWVRESKASVAA